jgi:inorganic pyrophosphatase
MVDFEDHARTTFRMERSSIHVSEIPSMKSLSDPTRLKLFDRKKRAVQVVIETPAGSRNKFTYDPEQGVFVLKSVLPAGMAFPYDFGFLPRTEAADGDPIDVLLLMDEPAFPGIVVKARLIGVIEGEQIEDGRHTRNDRLVAVANANHLYANVHRLKDLPSKWIRELENFFVNYHRLEGKQYRLLGCRGAAMALQLTRKAHRAS